MFQETEYRCFSFMRECEREISRWMPKKWDQFKNAAEVSNVSKVVLPVEKGGLQYASLPFKQMIKNKIQDEVFLKYHNIRNIWRRSWKKSCKMKRLRLDVTVKSLDNFHSAFIYYGPNTKTSDSQTMKFNEVPTFFIQFHITQNSVLLAILF